MHALHPHAPVNGATALSVTAGSPIDVSSGLNPRCFTLNLDISNFEKYKISNYGTLGFAL
ncbi:hypothetical protein PF010_g16210 [Phytophthora fragariae]|uniref:Uncharacterized protein n=1 Tax=Phytophthora fragariae TaxID=53985 RepID=A0A6G0KRN9_9STRA|nr:hypothetical protein PF010_g16210 [Phytophthora fragariae]